LFDTVRRQLTLSRLM